MKIIIFILTKNLLFAIWQNKYVPLKGVEAQQSWITRRGSHSWWNWSSCWCMFVHVDILQSINYIVSAFISVFTYSICFKIIYFLFVITPNKLHWMIKLYIRMNWKANKVLGNMWDSCINRPFFSSFLSCPTAEQTEDSWRLMLDVFYYYNRGLWILH